MGPTVLGQNLFRDRSVCVQAFVFILYNVVCIATAEQPIHIIFNKI